jgi:hypothetical protein
LYPLFLDPPRPGQNDPRSLTRGTRGSTRQDTLDQVNLVSGLTGPPRHGGQGAGRLTGDDGEARGRTGRGPTEPGPHEESSGEVGVAGGGPAATNLAAAELGYRRGNGDADGDLRHGESIPSAGWKRTARRSFSARRGSRGGRGTAALGVGHGGHARSCRLPGGTGELRRRDALVAGDLWAVFLKFQQGRTPAPSAR